MRLALPCLLLIAACGTKDDAGSCHARVEAMASHLGAPRSIAELRKGASASLTDQLDAIAAAKTPADLGVANARALQWAIADCPPAIRLFGQLAEVTGKGDARRSFMLDGLPRAIEACQCKASPEDVGAIAEVITGSDQNRSAP